VELPSGLLVAAGPDDVTVTRQDGGAHRARGTATLQVWQWDPARPAWAEH
jgi:hypothetical protein